MLASSVVSLSCSRSFVWYVHDLGPGRDAFPLSPDRVVCWYTRNADGSTACVGVDRLANLPNVVRHFSERAS